jgi:hypothetical protein
MSYEPLNDAIKTKAKSEGWSEIQESGIHLWGYENPRDVMPSPIPLDIQVTETCRSAGAVIGYSGDEVAKAIACLLKPTISPSSINFEKFEIKPLRIKKNKKTRMNQARNVSQSRGFS